MKEFRRNIQGRENRMISLNGRGPTSSQLAQLSVYEGCHCLQVLWLPITAKRISPAENLDLNNAHKRLILSQRRMSRLVLNSGLVWKI